MGSSLLFFVCGFVDLRTVESLKIGHLIFDT
jgi:hypothetical protein